MPVRISVVDSFQNDRVLQTDRRAHPNAVLSSDVGSFVAGVLVRANGQPIERMRIFGHGRNGQQNVGGGTHPTIQQVLTTDDSGALYHRAILSMLCGCFTPDAIVELHGCRVSQGGWGSLLLVGLGNLWRVRVRAGSVRQFHDRRDRIEGNYFEWDGSPNAQSHIMVS